MNKNIEKKEEKTREERINEDRPLRAEAHSEFRKAAREAMIKYKVAFETLAK